MEECRAIYQLAWQVDKFHVFVSSGKEINCLSPHTLTLGYS